ncbi:MAG: hypothetical protein PWQ15_193 [Methanobacterium sp.]|jgi:hypothetical protein|uniref:hypothetical protein n=1 Tax=Methanobacterium sp. TaxID=2164 RepID=UPI0003C9CF9C|nr:hypothetical protein [Methanobacterium sp.]MDI3549091.1 hypothetical protein [Methanobacterium sp.]CDG64291.1 hypothetical protein MBMB1_0173 [Methanobacterium sp. MB1]
MRRSFGIVDRRKILAYQPQLFKRVDDLLVFPARDFHQWHSIITEYLDGLFQIKAQSDPITIEDINLAFGLLTEIKNELASLFDSEKEMNFSYQYVSQMDPKYKMKDARIYGRDMYHVDRKVLKITPQVKYRHQMEILEYAHWLWAQKETQTILKVKKR